VIGKKSFKKGWVLGALTVVSLCTIFFASKRTQHLSLSASSQEIVAAGTVLPHRKLILHSEVSGRVQQVSSHLEEGQLVQKGEVLVVIDPRNYEVAVEEAKAHVAKAELELKIEQGRKLLAEKEWELLDPAIKENRIGHDLTLRKPFVLEKKAQLQAAKSRLGRALSDLEKTQVTAPFNAIVTKKGVEVGQVMNLQTEIATLVCTDDYHIKAQVPCECLEQMKFPEKEGEKGSEVVIRQRRGEEKRWVEKGHLLRFLGSIDGNSKKAHILVAVQDPFSLKNKQKEQKRKIPLLLGSEVEITFSKN
jgi:RND family efflux transporter MFP subunit